MSALALRTLDASGAVELHVYGEIGGWGDTCVRDVVDRLGAHPTSVTVRINSFGGDAFEGIAIYNALRSCGAPVTSIVEGIAASAASVIAMAGRVIVRRGAMLMIHPAGSGCCGTSDDHAKEAEILARLTSGVVDIYCAKTGLPREEIQTLVERESWLTADEAKALGLADEIEGSVAPQACAGGRIRLGSTTYPAALLPAQLRAAVPPRRNAMDLKSLIVAALVKAGRLKEDASDEEIVAVLLPLIGQAEPVEPEKPEEPPAPVPPPPAANAGPAPEMRAVCSLLAQAAGKPTLTPAEAIVELTTRLSQLPKPVDLAVVEKRITPAEAKAFRGMEATDPDACRAALAAFPKGRVGSLTAPNQVSTSAADAEVLPPVAAGPRLSASYEEMKAEFEAKKAAAAAGKEV